MGVSTTEVRQLLDELVAGEPIVELSSAYDEETIARIRNELQKDLEEAMRRNKLNRALAGRAARHKILR